MQYSKFIELSFMHFVSIESKFFVCEILQKTDMNQINLCLREYQIQLYCILMWL